jgi:hypothetical protein
VGEDVGAAAAEGVGEGEGLMVHVGIPVGVGEATNLNPPHAMRKRAKPDNQKTLLLIIASRLALPKCTGTVVSGTASPLPEGILLIFYEIASLQDASQSSLRSLQ